MGGFSMGGFMNPNRGFSEMYRCYSIAMMQSGSERDNVSYGGKSTYGWAVKSPLHSQLLTLCACSYPATICARKTL